MIYLSNSNLLFLKPYKVAGTSFEIALAEFATRSDIVTEIRNLEGHSFNGPKNNTWTIREIANMRRNDVIKIIYYRHLRQKFVQHTPANTARERLGANSFDQALKVWIIRNPFDYLVSSYFWYTRNDHQRLSFDDWLRSNPSVITKNQLFYTINGKEIVDFYIRYEYLGNDCMLLEQKVPSLSGLTDLLTNINTKFSTRPKTAKTQNFFRDDALLRTIEFFHRDYLTRFGYPTPNEVS